MKSSPALNSTAIPFQCSAVNAVIERSFLENPVIENGLIFVPIALGHIRLINELRECILVECAGGTMLVPKHYLEAPHGYRC